MDGVNLGYQGGVPPAESRPESNAIEGFGPLRDLADTLTGEREPREVPRDVHTRLSIFMMEYKFALDEVETKINILREEFELVHDYSPIEYVKSRLKSPESIVEKAQRISCPLSFTDICANIRDIAGIRITCSFITDTYKISDIITFQRDIIVTDIKDYIAAPKPNGYQSFTGNT